MATTEWSAGFEAQPAGSEIKSLGDDRIRALKLSIRERLQKGGHYMQDTVAPYNKDGRHVRGVGDGPNWYKANATDVLLEATSDTLVTAKNDLTINGALTAAGTLVLPTGSVTQSFIAANAATKIHTHTGIPSPAGIVAGANGNAGAGVFTSGTPSGTFLAWLSVMGYNTGGTNDKMKFELEWDNGNIGVWAGIGTVYSPLFAESGGSTTNNNVYGLLWTGILTGLANGSTHGIRWKVTNNHGGLTWTCVAANFALLELRR